MRRFALLLVVLVVIGGVVFYFGWIQIKLDEDSYGVIFTKTGGWEDQVVAPGEFTWRAARLLPTNLTLHLFALQPQTQTTNLRGSLPSASTYAALIETTDPFSYALTVDTVYRIRPGELTRLAREQGLRQEGLAAYYRRSENQMEQVVIESLVELLEDDGGLGTTASALDAVASAARAALERAFPELEFAAVTPTRLELPDLNLYNEARQRYLTVLDARTEAMRQAAQALADDQAVMDAGLARLERYGEILDQYPILLDYFSLMQEFPEGPVDLEALIPPPGS